MTAAANPSPSVRQAQQECLQLLTAGAPTLNRLHTRMSEDPGGWLDGLDDWERINVALALSYAALSAWDASNTPPDLPELN